MKTAALTIALLALPMAAQAAGPDARFSDGAYWSGAYVGGQFGWTWLHVDRQSLGISPDSAWDTDAAIGGGHAGYLHQFGNLVLGVEGDLSAWAMNGSDAAATSGGVSHGVHGNWLGSIRGRVGLAGQRWLAYATGGWQWANVSVIDTSTLNQVTTERWLHGWTAGGGIEVQVAPQISTGLEYRYIHLDGFTSGNNIATAHGGAYSLQNIHSVMGRVSLRLK